MSMRFLVVVLISTIAVFCTNGFRTVKRQDAHGQDDVPLAGEVVGESRSDVGAATCEDVFLMDGRDPVDLPSTWAEARDAFISLCEDHGGSLKACITEEEKVFAEFPEGEVPFNEDKVLCSWLGSRFAQLAGRPPVADLADIPHGVRTRSSFAAKLSPADIAELEAWVDSGSIIAGHSCPMFDFNWGLCESKSTLKGKGSSSPQDQCYAAGMDCNSKRNTCAVLRDSSSCSQCEQCIDNFSQDWASVCKRNGAWRAAPCGRGNARR